MDRAVKRIRPADYELSQIQDNLGNVLQQVLDRIHGADSSGVTIEVSPVLEQRNPAVQRKSVKTPALFVRGREDGGFQINQPTIQFGEPQTKNAQGGLDLQKDSELFSFGQIVAFGSQVSSDGFVVIPQVAGPAFRIAPNNAATCFQVNSDGSAGCTGSFNAASVISAQGFKSWLPPAHYWNPNYPGQPQTLVVPVVQTANGTASTVPWGINMPRAGSVTGISVVHSGASNLVCSVSIVRNGSQIVTANISNGVSSGSLAFPKGLVPFAAADYLSARVNYSAANINVCTQVAIEVEEGA